MPKLEKALLHISIRQYTGRLNLRSYYECYHWAVTCLFTTGSVRIHPYIIRSSLAQHFLIKYLKAVLCFHHASYTSVCLILDFSRNHRSNISNPGAKHWAPSRGRDQCTFLVLALVYRVLYQWRKTHLPR